MPSGLDLPAILRGFPASAGGPLLAAFVTDVENFGGMDAHEIRQQVAAFSPSQVTGDADAWRLFHTSTASAIDGLSADVGKVDDAGFQGSLPDAVRASHEEFLRESTAFADALTSPPRRLDEFSSALSEVKLRMPLELAGHQGRAAIGGFSPFALESPLAKPNPAVSALMETTYSPSVLSAGSSVNALPGPTAHGQSAGAGPGTEEPFGASGSASGGSSTGGGLGPAAQPGPALAGAAPGQAGGTGPGQQFGVGTAGTDANGAATRQAGMVPGADAGAQQIGPAGRGGVPTQASSGGVGNLGGTGGLGAGGLGAVAGGPGAPSLTSGGPGRTAAASPDGRAVSITPRGAAGAGAGAGPGGRGRLGGLAGSGGAGSSGGSGSSGSSGGSGISGSPNGTGGQGGTGGPGGPAGAKGGLPRVGEAGSANNVLAGRRGMGGMMGGAGGRGHGEDDDAYTPAEFLTSIENGDKLIGPLPRVVYPVIGSWND